MCESYNDVKHEMQVVSRAAGFISLAKLRVVRSVRGNVPFPLLTAQEPRLV